MKIAIAFALLLVSSFAIRVELERSESITQTKERFLRSANGLTFEKVSREQLNANIRTESLKNPSIDLTNFQDLQYSGPVSVGSNADVFDVVYDTGSGWAWVQAKGCATCSDSKDFFDPAASSTYESTGESKTLTYGKGQVSGPISYDTLGLPGYDGATTRFIPATEGKDNEGMQAAGIVGLTPVATGGEELFVDKLAETGVIDAKEFTTYIAHEDETSYIEFGTNHDVSDDQIAWTDLEKLPGTDGLIYWSTEFDTFSVGDNQLDLSYTSTIWDTGTSLIGFNPKDFETVLLGLAGDNQIYSVGQGFYAIETPSEPISNLNFVFNGHNIEVPSSEFVVEQQGYSIFLLMQIPLPGHLLGDQFLRGLRIIHDQEGLRLGVIKDNAVDELLK